MLLTERAQNVLASSSAQLRQVGGIYLFAVYFLFYLWEMNVLINVCTESHIPPEGYKMKYNVKNLQYTVQM